MRHSLPNFASDRSASAIASAVLQGLEVITANEGSFCIFLNLNPKYTVSFFICLLVSSPKYFIIEVSCRIFHMENENWSI
jgi:fibrillarin-like rRNA methylase